MIDHEQNVIGACLLGPDAYWRCADLLTADDFASTDNARIWRAIGEKARADYDCFVIAELVPDLETYCFQLAAGGFTPRTVRTYAEIVAKASERRRFQRTRERIAHAESIDDAYALLAACRPKDSSSVKLAREYFRASLAALQGRAESERAVTGIPTSIPKLDEMTCGWQPGNLVILGARPSAGKTALALQVALQTACEDGQPVLFFSQEQSGVELMDRATSHLGRVPFDAIRNPKLMADEHWPRVTAAGTRIIDAPLHIDESCALGIDAICARSRQIHAELKLSLIVIDYLQHMSMPRADTLAEATQIITRALKSLAKELKVPVLLLSQLNRAGVGRPTMADLRNSGAIEQDADVILLMYRPDDAVRTHTVLIVEKQRNGVTGDLHLESRLDLMRFDHYPNPPSAAASAPRPRSFGKPSQHWQDKDAA